MDWARNRLGDIVAASQSGLSTVGLVCPVCGQAVYKRAGPERRPHFAHYSHRARPDCENYFPATYQRDLTLAPDLGARPKRGTLRCGIFLSRSSSTQTFSLLLKIPSLSTGGDGTIHIQSGVGMRSFTRVELSRARFVTLRPQVPLAVCSGTGGLLPAAMEIQAELAEFRTGISLFVGGDDGGRRLQQEEPAEWGGRYWLVSPDRLELPTPIIEFVEWDVVGRLADWFIYSLRLPRVIAASQIGLRHVVEDFIERKVHGAKASVHVAAPMPHHYDVDGAFVYPEAPQKLLLRTTSAAPISVMSIGGTAPKVRRLSETWVEVTDIDSSGREAVICLNNHEQLLIRVDACELFRPLGVLNIGDGEATDLIVGPSPSVNSEPRLVCPSRRVAEHLHKLNPDWQIDDRLLTSEHGRAFDGRGYGVIRSEEASPEVLQVDFTTDAYSNGRVAPAQRWLEGVITQRFGQMGRDALRAHLAGNANRLCGDMMTRGPLAFHIRSLKARAK